MTPVEAAEFTRKYAIEILKLLADPEDLSRTIALNLEIAELEQKTSSAESDAFWAKKKIEELKNDLEATRAALEYARAEVVKVKAEAFDRSGMQVIGPDGPEPLLGGRK